MPDPVGLAGAAIELVRLQRQQWLRPEQLRALQWRRLGAIVRHAEVSSPFYRQRFRAAGFTARDLRDWSDLLRLPVTTRRDLQHPEALVADGLDPQRMERSRTTGSTGTPTTTYFDRRAWLMGRFVLKARARVACGLRPWDRVAIFREDAPARLRPAMARRTASFSVHQPPEEVLGDLHTYAPTAIYGPPSHLARLALTGAAPESLRLVFTSAEMLDTMTRRTLEEGFDAPVLDVYGCTETKEVAWECPEREGYHVNAEWLLVEVLDGSGPEGLPEGTVLLTSLYNRGMPLLRYQVGDTGRLVPGTCSCGRGLPLVLPVLGRSVDYLDLPDGRTVSPYSLTCAVENVPGIAQYQIVQTRPDRVVVRVVPGDSFGDATRPAITAALRPTLGGLDIEIEETSHIPTGPGGKFRVVRSDVRGRTR